MKKNKQKKNTTTQDSQNEPNPEETIRNLEQRIETLTDNNLHLLADMENFRKRMQKELVNAHKFSADGIVTELLEPMDNFERALLSVSEGDIAESPKNIGLLIQGLKMVIKQFDSILAKNNITPVKAELGMPLDPNNHEAFAQEKVENKQPGEIIRVLHKGYHHHERLLRPALVIVAK